MINNTLQENDKHLHQDNALYRISPQVGQLLQLKDRKSFSARYLKPALQAGLIEMTLADKPNSRLQQYRLKQL